MMNTLEGFHIYKETKAGNQINDRLTVKQNAIFETVIHEALTRGKQLHSLEQSYFKL